VDSTVDPTALLRVRGRITGMSDFDREEERRKLEEKYGKEAEDRERTERLSELLLKGATMTDIHCPECGDPIFRHEGRQFCPSCQREVATDESQQATAGQAAAQDPLADEAAEPEPSTDGHEDIEVDTSQPDADDGESEPEPAPEPDAGGTPETEPQQPTPQQPEPAATQDSAQPPSGSERTGRAAPAPTPQPSTGGDASGLLPARQHLTRTVNRLAEQAAAEEDPGRKREFLAATREAAEALEAVRDAE
jgi:uncharacterized Zn finger protein (UPF0148 family)